MRGRKRSMRKNAKNSNTTAKGHNYENGIRFIAPLLHPMYTLNLQSTLGNMTLKRPE